MKMDCLNHLEKAHELAEQLLRLADQGDAEREDVGCGIVFGALRDCGYKIRALVDKEIKIHQQIESVKETKTKPA
jgi:hypothetical protein